MLSSADLWTPGQPLDGDAIELARVQRQRIALTRLLQPHKIQLLAMEKAAAGEGQNAVRRARGLANRQVAAKRAIRSAHVLSRQMAIRHLRSEFAAMGVPLPRVPDVGYAFPDQLHRDLLPALGNTQLSRDEVLRRVGIAVVSAVNRAYTDQQLAVYRAAEAASQNTPTPIRMRKQWATNKMARTAPCRHCTWLDGRVADLDAEFPLPPGVRAVYGGTLLGPPLHPNCRCRLIPRLVRA